jgi:hypothetical protein
MRTVWRGAGGRRVDGHSTDEFSLEDETFSDDIAWREDVDVGGGEGG